MATLVGNDPDASAEEALESRVHAPESDPRGGGGDVLGRHEVVEDIEGGGKAGHVTQDICPAVEGRALEAVLGDGISKLLDGVVGRGELVAVQVNEVGILGRLLGGVNIDGRERRQGRGRGRVTRRVGRRNGS